MKNFQKEKKDFLNKLDKSKKGSIDKDSAKVIKIINSYENYFTTSSCGGRIVLLEKGKRKDDCNWLFVKHSEVSFKEIFDVIEKYTGKNEVWFKQEPFIIHIRCKDLGASQKLLVKAKTVFKRTTLASIKENRITLEICGTERIDTIVADSKFKVSEDYLKQLVKYANSKFMENKKKIGKLEKVIQVIVPKHLKIK